MKYLMLDGRQQGFAGIACGLLMALSNSAVASGNHLGAVPMSTISTHTMQSSAHEMEAMKDDSQGHHHSTSAAGEPGAVAAISRTLHLEGDDSMRFSPAKVSVKQGETLRLVVTNSGKLAHEFVIATAAEQQQHQQMMQSMPNMTHAEANAVSLKPGETKQLVWHFTQPGNIEFACHEPGHYVAGMHGTITVTAAP